jgi:ParB-like chromosome segregation protein Spo0J
VRVNGRLYRTPFHEPGLDLAGNSWESFLGCIRGSGQLLPIYLDENGDVIDGRQRLRTCAVLGSEPKVTVKKGLDQAEKERLWIKLNLDRSHHEPYSELE